MTFSPQGKAIIFSAPSGTGKTTIAQQILAKNLPLEFSISACSRSPRPHEVNGKDYYFLGINGFKEKVEHDEFLEWEEVYPDQFYGTLNDEIERIWSHHHSVVFDVDVYGGIALKEKLGDKALAIFIAPPSMEILESRLRGRQTESEENIKTRLAKAKEEMAQQQHFDRVVVNDDLSEAVETAFQIIQDFLAS